MKKEGQVLALVRDAARVLGCSSELVSKLTDRGDLPVVGRTVRGVRVMRLADVERYAREQTSDKGKVQ
jgi:hypothetical protein